jgi:hypothetical protein
MNSYDLYIYSVFMCKLIMILSAIIHLILKRSSVDYTTLHRINIIKEIFEFLFVFMMAVLLMYIFNPLSPKEMNAETRLLFFLLGVILLITARYSIFFKESKSTIVFEKIQKLFGK